MAVATFMACVGVYPSVGHAEAAFNGAARVSGPKSSGGGGSGFGIRTFANGERRARPVD
jgi:hypothetical protein